MYKMKFINVITLLSSLFSIAVCANTNNLKGQAHLSKKAEMENTFENVAQYYARKVNFHQNASASGNQTLDTLQASLYKDLNTTYVVKDSNAFRTTNRKWDYKILDKHLEEIFRTMLYKKEDRTTTNGIRNYMEIFVNQYVACDQDKDNVLNPTEFQSCMQSDPYFSQLVPPDPRFATNTNYSAPTSFYSEIFNILDDRFDGYVNFVGYMRIRLMAFSWRQCSLFAPFLEEVDFECAIEIVSDHKTLTRTQARNVFRLALELSNNFNLRTLDFISYFIIANSVRLYGSINSKEDGDITRSEFNLALDDNLLPIRYGQEIIDQLFQMVDDYDRPNQGLDLQSFIFYDFILQLYGFNKKVRPYYLSFDDFITILNNPLFPNKTLAEIYLIPQYNLSAPSYQMYEYFNISQYISEGDYLYKFLEVGAKVESQTKEKSKLKKAGSNTNSNTDISNQQIDPRLNTNFFLNFSLNSTAKAIFQAMDYDQDGWVNFYDLGTLMQLVYTFGKADPYSKGRMTAGSLYDLYKTYADYPAISFRLRERAERFNLFDQNIYVDVMSTYLIMKVDDIVKYFTRKTDTTVVYEVELKRIMSMINMRYVPDTYFHRCLRGVDYSNKPKYDWECSFVEGMKLNLQYYESMYNYKTVQANNLTMLNTVFYNIDPTYK